MNSFTQMSARKAVTVGGAVAVTLVGAALFILSIGGGAVAQTLQPKQQQSQAAPAPQPGPPAVWMVSCSDNKGALDCRAGQSVFIKTTGQRLLSVAVRVPPDTKKPVLLVQVPLGVYLPAGISLQIGKDPAKMLPYKACDQGGCLAEYAITDAEIGAMLKAADLIVSAQNQNQQPAFAVTVPTTGFPEAYAKVKVK